MTRCAILIAVFILLAGFAHTPVFGQENPRESSPIAEPGVAATITPAPEATQSATEQLVEAYQREFAFLEAQRRELAQRLGALDETQAQQSGQLETGIRALEERLLALQGQRETLQDRVSEAERSEYANSERRAMLDTAFTQADATWSQYGLELTEGDAFVQLEARDKVTLLFERGVGLLRSLSQVRIDAGEFFLKDGVQVQGSLIHIGNIATYGVSEAGDGALAPAGGGGLQVWKDAGGEDARALMAGQAPDPLHLFLYENLATPVSQQDEQSVMEHIHSGGMIAWIIVGLGVLALILTIARAFFLRRAGTGTGSFTERVVQRVRQGREQEALKMCEGEKNATARVMAAALRNLDRDREHIEDIVSESILHERGYLNRFGAFILVIAAVAPLLGLLGTVTGMITTFDVITRFGTGDPALLSGGISVALVTTELGLVVAIPTLVFGNLLSGWAERIKNDMEKAALRVVNQHQDHRVRPERQAA